MGKKIVLSTLLIGLIGVLIAGAIIRTMDKTENIAEARGAGQGRGANEHDVNAADQGYTTNGQQSRGGGNGQGGGNSQSGSDVERQYPNYETPPQDWATYEGSVIQAPVAGEDLVIATDDGQQMTVGTGPGYMEAQGFALQAGEQVQVQGYWEDNELKAAQITRLRDGQTITLRDQDGRPAWAGNGNRSAEQQAAGQQAAGQQGGNGQGGQGQGGGGGQSSADAPGDGTGTGQAQVDEWLTLQGTVISLDDSMLVVEVAGDEQVTVENRPWWFAQEQGLAVQVNDQVTLTGFYENGEFEVGRIDNLSTGQSVSIRDENGRPLWAGRGRRGS